MELRHLIKHLKHAIEGLLRVSLTIKANLMNMIHLYLIIILLKMNTLVNKMTHIQNLNHFLVKYDGIRRNE